MEFLKEILGEGYEAFAQAVKQYNEKSPDKAVKLANLAEGGYVSKEKYTALEAEAGGYKEQLTGLREDLQKLQEEGGGKAELNNKLSALQEKYDADMAAFTEKLAALKLETAVDNALFKAGAVDSDLVKVKLDMGQIRLAESGEVEGLEEQLGNVKRDYGFLFQSAPRVTGAKPAEPSPAPAAMTREEYQKLGYEERVRLKTERPEIFKEIGGIN